MANGSDIQEGFPVMRAWVLGITVLAVLGGSVGAAECESIFSSLGLGETLLPTTARGRGMGGTGISVIDTVSGSFLNPATASLVERVTLSVVYVPEVRYPAGPEGASRNWSSRLSALSVVFPFPRGVSVSVGLGVWGDMSSEARWTGSNETTAYEGRHEREGGIFALPFSLSFPLGERVLMAVGLSLTQVSSRETWSKLFPSAEYQDTRDVPEGEFSGARLSGALLIRGSEKVSLGLVAYQGRDLEGTVRTRTIFGGDFESTASAHLPALYGAGLCYHPRPGWSLAVEGWRTRWGDFRIADAAPLPDRVTHRVAVGLERAPERKTGSRLARLPLRVGYWSEPAAFDRPDGEKVVTRMVTLGTGFPLVGRGAWLDLAVEVGRVGEGSINGAQEKVVRFSLGLIASEKWHRKRQTRY